MKSVKEALSKLYDDLQEISKSERTLVFRGICKKSQLPKAIKIVLPKATSEEIGTNPSKSKYSDYNG